ncbi:MAG TPA: flagellar biosynthetic protein FliR [Polyangiales bacterium]|jgi:flagellar biosynthesis protein FliR|nr:flagellar biosynthetic protein FliR [Polyangiales bacterium]
MAAEVTLYLHVSLLLWLRCAPVFVLTPYLGVGAGPGVWTALLSWACAGALTPIVLAGCYAGSACAAVLSGGLTWGLAGAELVAGIVIGLGLGLPCAAFRGTGAIAQALAGSSAAAPSSMSQLGRAAGLTALVVAASAGVLSGVAQLFLSVAPPLSAASAPSLDLLRPLSDQLVQAFEIGVSLCGPLLLAAAFIALVAGLCSRIAGLRFSSAGPALLPWLGIALVTLCVATWLDSVPELVRAFAHSTTRLLDRLP